MHDGFGPKTDNTYEEYRCGKGMPGLYEIQLTHIQGNIVGKKVRIQVIGEADIKGRYYTLQVASYADKASARKLRDELEPDYPNVRIESNDGWFRVLVGRFEKEKKAREAEQRLRREGREVLFRTEIEP